MELKSDYCIRIDSLTINMINKNCFQIYISDNNEIPTQLLECIKTIKANCKDYKYQLFQSDELRDFINDNFDKDVIKAYDQLIPYAYKADLGRYCLLHKLGGWYFDISTTMTSKLPVVSNLTNIVFRDHAFPAGRPSWETCTSVIYSEAGSTLTEMAISMVVENVKNKYYGQYSLDPTGPGVFGRALAKLGPNKKTFHGMYIPLTPNHKIKNFACVLPSGKILAWGKKTHGTSSSNGLAHFGATGVNSYLDLYRSRKIYSEK